MICEAFKSFICNMVNMVEKDHLQSLLFTWSHDVAKAEFVWSMQLYMGSAEVVKLYAMNLDDIPKVLSVLHRPCLASNPRRGQPHKGPHDTSKEFKGCNPDSALWIEYFVSTAS